ncbi:phage terminase large subunit [Burkholderia pseudomallei]|uniref:phage terminase large subunit n=1 Tax=Burkholderia pseudomallei TaxID=28450 RepID=UPI000F0701A3|nr:phage terminase large subunit [Burkholderia pseudomallei]VBI24595.1 Transcription termination factor [Burkholderia pseudomallei]
MNGCPWWWESEDPIREDFRNLLFLIWEHLALPMPTPAQMDIAYFLQFGWAGYGIDPDGNYFEWYGQEEVEPDRTGCVRMGDADNMFREDIIEAFRGIGKSYVTSGFVLWRLYRDPFREKILVISASGNKAKEFVSMTKMILLNMDILAHLRPREDQRDTAISFDVNGASISQSPSVRSVGITGQITGSRATLIVADDIEVVDNSRTEDARERLLHKTNEFAAIKVTGGADVIYLGTPQTEESIYTKLIREMGATGWILPARYPLPDKRESYVFKREGMEPLDCLAPRARRVDLDATLQWKPTDPERFNEVELQAREAKGRSYFALQFQLDTSLSDAERYPLKQSDLIVMACNPFKAPQIVQWGHDTNGRNRRVDLKNVGFTGDQWLAPLFVDTEWREYEQSLLFVDPSGRGKDETAWAIVKTLNGMLYAVASGGISGDPGTAMAEIAMAAKTHKVNEIVVEPNYAGAVWISAFEPILAKVWPAEKPSDTAGCTVREAEWSRTQKEVRIIETLEPVMTTHRLVVDERVASDEVLMYQLTHVTRERNCLSHDDRLDALAGAVAELVATLRIDTNQAAREMKEAEEEALLEEFIEGCLRSAAGDYALRTFDGERVYQHNDHCHL